MPDCTNSRCNSAFTLANAGLKISRGNIERLFDLRHSSRLEHLDAAFAALGRRLTIGVAA